MQEFDTPHGTIPFDKIKPEHYLPALKVFIGEAEQKLEEIISNSDTPTFENTMLPLETDFAKLEMLHRLFYFTVGTITNEELQKVAREFMPLISKFWNKASMNEELFERIHKIYKTIDKQDFTPEQKTLIKKNYNGSIRKGAMLNKTDKKRFAEIQTELSTICSIYPNNVRKETNAYELHITNEEELAGLPDFIKKNAAFEAKKRKKEGWVFTLHYPIYGPFMRHSENRDLRKKLYKAYHSKGNNGNKYCNIELVKKMVNLRLEMANLLGYKNYAEYVLEERMAENVERVNGFLADLHKASLPYAKKELEAVQQYAKNNGADFELQWWDWSYYSNKLKQEKYNISDEMTKPYFELGNVTKGVFKLANRLYGITIKEVDNIAKYHKDVKTYEVYDEKNKFLAVLYMDFFPRKGKGAGDRSGEFRPQSNINGKMIRPQIYTICNFSKPTDTTPALLSFYELNSFLHEFGHNLHSIFSQCTYPSLSGAKVLRDFLELPSQLMQNWAVEKEFLDLFAVHYKTGEKIPQELVQKLVDSQNFNRGNSFEGALGRGMLDMAWYTLEKPFNGDVIKFDQAAVASTELIPTIEGIAESTYLAHIFCYGYDVGYYTYKWAEVLDADAFSVFKKKGIFDKKTAASFRKNILEKGGSEHPMILYKRFRGQEPRVDGLLKRSGLK